MSLHTNTEAIDIPQDYPESELWDAFKSEEVAAVFAEEFRQQHGLHEFLENHGLTRTRDMLARTIEWRERLRAVADAQPTRDSVSDR